MCQDRQDEIDKELDNLDKVNPNLVVEHQKIGKKNNDN